MPDIKGSEVTQILARISEGDAAAKEELLHVVYAELRRIAANYMSRERPDHTLQPTALVNEAYLRVLGNARPSFTDREHFFATASRVMRRLLVDHARKHRAEKRGAGMKITFNEDLDAPSAAGLDVLLVDEVLEKLSLLDPRAAQVVEMKFFGGMKEAEIAEALQIHPATVRRDWSFARAWLFKNLHHPAPPQNAGLAG